MAVVHGMANGGIQRHMLFFVAGFHFVDKETVVVEKWAFLKDRAILGVGDVEHCDGELHAVGWSQKGLR